MTSVAFDIPIIYDRMIFEGNENFTLTIDLLSLTHFIFIGSPGQATVTIVDDYCKLNLLALRIVS